MRKVCFYLGFFLPLPISFFGALVESKYRIPPMGALYASEMASIAVFLLLVLGPHIYRAQTKRQERLARRRDEEALEAEARRLESEMISKQAAQDLRLKLLREAELPKPRKNKGGRPRKPIPEGVARALEEASYRTIH